jgi:nickel-dependent lactate racemase
MNFKCGQTELSFPLNQWKEVSVLEASQTDQQSEETHIIEALKHPIDSKPLCDLIRPDETVCIVVSDITRAYQRMWVYLPHLIQELEKANIPDKNIFFLSANGTHRQQSQAEHRKILGDALYDRFSIYEHFGTDLTSVSPVGITQYGNEIKLNTRALQADHIILTGAIVFHDLAGFGGGRKSLLPGIAASESIQRNHRLALVGDKGDLHPDMGSGKMENNPLNREMQEVADWIKPTFILNVAIGGNGKISQAFAGHYRAAHEAGQDFVRNQDGKWIDKQGDLVIGSAGGHPKDINFYQATKAISNMVGAVKPGGTLLLFAECAEGIGYQEMAELLLSPEDIPTLAKMLLKRFSVARYIGFWMRTVTKRMEVLLVSKLPSEPLAAIGIRNFTDADSAYAYLEGKSGIEHVIAIPKAGQVYAQWKGIDQ